MHPRFRHIQKVCKPNLWVLFSVVFLFNCGSTPQPTLQTMNFADNSVPFQNNKCSTQITLINDGTEVFTLVFLTAAFKDNAGHERQIELDQTQMINTFDPITFAQGGISHGNVVFDLTGSGFVPPISASVIVVATAGSQVTHFVGDFTCQ